MVNIILAILGFWFLLDVLVYLYGSIHFTRRVWWYYATTLGRPQLALRYGFSWPGRGMRQMRHRVRYGF